MRKKCIFLISILFFIGCGGSDKPLYEGLTLKTWVDRLATPDDDIRLDALRVIASIGVRGRAAESYVLEIAREDPSPKVRLAAIEALESMGVPIVEFGDFLDLCNSPLIPTEDVREYEEIEEEFGEGASGENDLEYLKQLEYGEPDSFAKDTVMIPEDPDERLEWANARMSESMADILTMLDNPQVLTALLQVGDKLERLYAAQKLSQFSGDNIEIINALELLQNSPDSSLKKAASEALKHWKTR